MKALSVVRLLTSVLGILSALMLCFVLSSCKSSGDSPSTVVSSCEINVNGHKCPAVVMRSKAGTDSTLPAAAAAAADAATAEAAPTNTATTECSGFEFAGDLCSHWNSEEDINIHTEQNTEQHTEQK